MNFKRYINNMGKISSWILIIPVLLALIFIIYKIIYPYFHPLPLVNLQDVVTENSEENYVNNNVNKEQATNGDKRPVFRIAVGAMISPKTTKGLYNDFLRIVGDELGRKTVFSQRKTYAEINQLVKNQELDLAWVCSGPYVEGHREFGMEILAVPMVNGKPVYYSYILANSSSTISSFQELKGKKFAFTDPYSNTGSLVPTYMLAQMGETPQSYFKETFFTYSHDNSIKAVASGLADGSAVDSLIWDYFKVTRPQLVAKTKIIQKSSSYGIPPIVVHPDLNVKLKKQIKMVLLSLHQNPRAKKYLDELQIQKFVGSNDVNYNTVRQMQDYVNKKQERTSEHNSD